MKQIIVGVVVILVALGVIYMVDSKRGVHDVGGSNNEASEVLSLEEKAARFSQYKEIVRPSGFVNTKPLQLKELIGEKVVLLDIMTYSCINCQRTYPYLNAWYEKYKDQGLEIVGIHTPEFQFEHDIENVREAMERYGITFPVVLDNEYGTWSAYENRYWPRKYLIDIDGYVVYDHIGEGGYAETEKRIQELLMELNEGEVGFDADVVAPEDAEKVNTLLPRSPETYFGLLRNQNLGVAVKAADDGVVTFVAPTDPKPNQLYLIGDWMVTEEYGEAVSADARLYFGYSAQKVFVVASSEDGGVVEVLVDGEAVAADAGEHVEDGAVRIQNEQLYRLIEAEKHGRHGLELKVEKGVRLFAFTFG